MKKTNKEKPIIIKNIKNVGSIFGIDNTDPRKDQKEKRAKDLSQALYRYNQTKKPYIAFDSPDNKWNKRRHRFTFKIGYKYDKIEKKNYIDEIDPDSLCLWRCLNDIKTYVKNPGSTKIGGGAVTYSDNCGFDNLLFEMDPDKEIFKDPLKLREHLKMQRRIIDVIEDMTYEVVFSGNKSYHIIIKSPGSENKEEYHERWETIKDIIEERLKPYPDLLFFFQVHKFDKNTKSNCNLTRLPGAMLPLINTTTGKVYDEVEQELYLAEHNTFDLVIDKKIEAKRNERKLKKIKIKLKHKKAYKKFSFNFVSIKKAYDWVVLGDFINMFRKVKDCNRIQYKSESIYNFKLLRKNVDPYELLKDTSNCTPITKSLAYNTIIAFYNGLYSSLNYFTTNKIFYLAKQIKERKLVEMPNLKLKDEDIKLISTWNSKLSRKQRKRKKEIIEKTMKRYWKKIVKKAIEKIIDEVNNIYYGTKDSKGIVNYIESGISVKRIWKHICNSKNYVRAG